MTAPISKWGQEDVCQDRDWSLKKAKQKGVCRGSTYHVAFHCHQRRCSRRGIPPSVVSRRCTVKFGRAASTIRFLCLRFSRAPPSWSSMALRPPPPAIQVKSLSRFPNLFRQPTTMLVPSESALSSDQKLRISVDSSRVADAALDATPPCLFTVNNLLFPTESFGKSPSSALAHLDAHVGEEEVESPEFFLLFLTTRFHSCSVKIKTTVGNRGIGAAGSPTVLLLLYLEFREGWRPHAAIHLHLSPTWSFCHLSYLHACMACKPSSHVQSILIHLFF